MTKISLFILLLIPVDVFSESTFNDSTIEVVMNDHDHQNALSKEKGSFKSTFKIGGKETTGTFILKKESSSVWKHGKKVLITGVLESNDLRLEQFTLSRPENELYTYEWMFNRILAYEGFSVPAFRLMKLTVNGEAWGVFFLKTSHSYPPQENDNGKEIDQMLALWDTGHASFEETFDIDQLAKYFAACDLFNAQLCSQIERKNLQYSSSGKLSIIHRTGGVNLRSSSRELFGFRNIHTSRSSLFLDAYGRYLNAFSLKYHPELPEGPAREFSRGETLLIDAGESIEYTPAAIGDRVKWVRSELDYTNKFFEFYVASLTGRRHLTLVETAYRFPFNFIVYIDNGKQEEARILHWQSDARFFNNKDKTIENSFVIELPRDASPNKIRFEAIFSDGKSRHYQSQPFTFNAKERTTPNLTKLLTRHPFFVKNKDREIRIKSGDWQIDRDVVVPRGYKIIGEAPLNLKFSKEAAFISYSPLILKGRADAPITLTAMEDSWPGLFVINSPGENHLANVTIEKLSGISRGAWVTYAGITFFESPVTIVDSNFSTSNCEDLMGIFNSRFSIKNSVFRDSKFDSLDIDFGSGEIVDTQFLNSGNDAVDFSGSQISMQGILIKDAVDKGVSVGEKSNLTLRNIHIENSQIGLAAKDSSKIEMQKVKISSARDYGIVVFQKKPEYGPAVVTGSDVVLENNKQDYLLEVGSQLSINNRKNLANGRQVMQKLYR